ncbi:ammonium transporter [Puniceicoccales bacterium CK1056]|uniref:Ammonium transporter n=1 Tax=Oceanipulchritudo coccoides TaxID=2706888 RepID=A0A6B2M3T5_9BACT|nr:ammonium transporter [Oceanipulchritudo coccoides]NDV62764.1 ammonium transporter [Oceanipulchritudo coccoides]
MINKRKLATWALLPALMVLMAGSAFGQELAVPEVTYETYMGTAASAFFTVSNLWLLIAAGLVFIMHLGFATLESGLTQSKNTVNILFKNVFIICMGVLTYAVWGFNSMYPGDFNGFFAMGSPIPNSFSGADVVANMTGEYADYTYWTDFIFQAMFAATAATIVSGAVAERIKLGSFMIGATLLVTICYPITGSWQWGGGWLAENGFYDFAGSSLVHAFGGFAALAAVIILGARKGKYLAGGKIRPILGHSMPLATIGVFLLFLGWFGFNGGSVLSADPQLVSLVFVTTAIAAAAGGLVSILVSWVVIKKPDLSMALNGILAGLVGITAGADSMGPWAAVAVGGIAGAIVVFAILFFDKIKIDDPVGAISVHGVCGMWGTIAVGIFGGASLLWQIIGTVSISIFAFVTSFIVFTVVKLIFGLRVSEEEEVEGLDIGEHGQEAYPDFQVASKG